VQKLKKVLVVDWLDAYGGAERILANFDKVFKFSKTYTLINLMPTNQIEKIYNNKNPLIIETPIKIFKKKFRFFFFLFHYFISRVKLDTNADIIISSSHSVAKGIKKTNKKQIHISYFQARNFNYIWEDVDLFFGKSKFLFYPIIYLLRTIDVRQAQNPDFIIANSNFVSDWVKYRYNREAFVIYPPVDLSSFNLVEKKEDYYVAVGRIVTVKRFDLVVEAFNQSGKKLVIIGDGENLNKIKVKAKANIIFTGFLDSKEVRRYVECARAFIQMGVEGFGIAPIEAQACGTPVIAYGKGGVLETVINGESGLFFKEQSVTSLQNAIQTFEKMQFNPKLIRENALQFSIERFEKEINEFVEEQYYAFIENKFSV
jgi:glycosyltransferase involved in cell wall biosynthesis